MSRDVDPIRSLLVERECLLIRLLVCMLSSSVYFDEPDWRRQLTMAELEETILCGTAANRSLRGEVVGQPAKAMRLCVKFRALCVNLDYWHDVRNGVGPHQGEP